MEEGVTAQRDERLCLGPDDREAGNAFRAVSGAHHQP